MKKTLLTILAGVGVCLAANAQVITTQDFESAVAPALPTGWTQVVPVGCTNWSTGSNTALQSQYFPITAHTNMVCINDDGAGQTVVNNDNFLKSDVFAIPGGTHPYLAFDQYFFAGTYNSQTESLKVEISTNGGGSFTVLQTMTGNASGDWERRYIDLSPYIGMSNLMIGFRYSDGGGWLFGAALDNVTVFTPNPTDVKVNSMTFPKITLANSTLSYTVTNMGYNAITSLDVSYKVDAGTPVAQNFPSLNIAPFASTTLSFTTGVAAGAGAHTLNVNATQVNGGADANTTDNQVNGNFVIASATVPRSGLIEEFSSSTCSPCASFNSTFDPLVVSNNANTTPSKFNVVKYQMNWPSPNNDPSFNTGGDTRRGYYGVTGIPDHFTNGAAGGAGDQAEITASKTAPAFMTITGTYTVHGSTLNASATVTPKFTITGGNYSVHMVAAERHYTNNDPVTATVGQHEFYYVERTMFPSGSGTAVANWTDGVAQTFTQSKPFVNGSPAQGNDNFWTNPVQSDLVIFVQDNADKTIMQSAVVPASWPTGVKELNGIADMAIFPNPATSQAMLGFNTTESQNIDISVVDAMGRTVYTYSQMFEAGSQRIVVPTANFAAGLYNVLVRTNSGIATQRLTVTK